MSTQTTLVVDPEVVVREIMQAILEREGYLVISVPTAREALDILRTTSPALIITNVFLTDMSGHAAMERFKEVCPSIPVLMVSGLPDDPIIQHWIAQPGFDAFPKPFKAAEFTAKVKEVLTGAGSAARSGVASNKSN